jgi:hypothetical protein
MMRLPAEFQRALPGNGLCLQSYCLGAGLYATIYGFTNLSSYQLETTERNNKKGAVKQGRELSYSYGACFISHQIANVF